MKQIVLATLLSFSALILTTACGGGDDSDSSSCKGPGAMSSAPKACSSCIESSCHAQLSAYCSDGCANDSDSSACQKAMNDVEHCIVSNCASPCNASDPGGGDGGDGPGSGSGSGPGNIDGDDIAACYIAVQNSCTAAPVGASDKPALDEQCTQAGGVASDRCPSADLIGCCTFGLNSFASSQVCSYKAGSGFDEASCSAASGSWSKTP